MSHRAIPVGLEGRGYDVLVGTGLLDAAGGLIAPFAPRRRIAIVTDETVAALHLARLRASLEAAGLAASAIILPPGEGQKSWAGLEHLSERLLALELERRDIVIAFGGGVIGDLAGFAAGVLKRGIDFVQIPTTLLAQVDSSVGGKTAINARAGKNLVGLFHQPRLVLADLDVLATLPARERMAGYAEIVKYGLIDDPAFFAWCEGAAARVLAGEAEALARAIETSVAAKARVVAADEREGGVRALLNLGHTFAHAFEAEIGFDDRTMLHGEAVGLGLGLAFRFSAAQGLCPPEDAARVSAHLDALGFSRPRNAPGGPFEADRLLAAMAHDKKVEDGRLTFILARGIGASFIARDVSAAAVREFLQGELS
jgi:3-dehydroquinate synthase